MTVGDQIRTVFRASEVQKRNPGLAVISVEIHPQVFLRLLWGMHDRVIHRRVGDADPCDALAVLFL